MTVFSLMKARLQMLGERQKVIAENVANVSTPGYVPSDVDAEAFAATLQRMAGRGQAGAPGRTTMVATNPLHLAPQRSAPAGVTKLNSPDSETTLDGNSVVVEEQMIKIAETRMDFETMVGLYQKSLGLLRLASRSPSR
jgi:flagellar basal-body rod protein FlgB